MARDSSAPEGTVLNDEEMGPSAATIPWPQAILA